MKDCLGREIKQGDLVIGMVISRDSDGMRFGIATDKNIQWARIYSGKVSLGKISTTSNMYLVENPCDKEIEIKNKIVKIMDEYNAKLLKIKSLKAIPSKQLEIGKSYKDEKGSEYIYLGYGKVESNKYYNEEGYIYLRKTELNANGEFKFFPWYVVSKRRKKLVEQIDDLMDFKFEKEFKILGEKTPYNQYWISFSLEWRT